MRDFTTQTYSQLLDALIAAGYEFQTFKDYLVVPKGKVVILRHDVDKKPGNSLHFVHIEHEKGLRPLTSLELFRHLCKWISSLRSRKIRVEIVYRYEDLDPAKGDQEL